MIRVKSLEQALISTITLLQAGGGSAEERRIVASRATAVLEGFQACEGCSTPLDCKENGCQALEDE